MTREDLTQDVLTTVLPDDDQCGEDHPWPELVIQARACGLDVTEDALRRLPYEVELSDTVTRWLADDELT